MKNLATAAGSGIQLIGLSNRMTLPIVWLPVEKSIDKQAAQTTTMYFSADMTDLYREDCPSLLDRVIGTHFKFDASAFKLHPESVNIDSIGRTFCEIINKADTMYRETDTFVMFWQYLMQHNELPIYSCTDVMDTDNIMSMYAIEFAHENHPYFREDRTTVSASFCKKVGYIDADLLKERSSWFDRTYERMSLDFEKRRPKPIAHFLKMLEEGDAMQKMDCPVELFDILNTQYKTYKHLISLGLFSPSQLFNDPENYRGNENG